MEQKNYMEGIANLFGLKLGEVFYLEYEDIFGCTHLCRYIFTEDGLMHVRDSGALIPEDDSIFTAMLKGKEKVIKDEQNDTTRNH